MSDKIYINHYKAELSTMTFQICKTILRTNKFILL